MLSKEEKEEILEGLNHFPFPEAFCIDALKIVQQHRGWISNDAIKDIADIIEMTVSEVDSRATFYTRIYRKPVGRNIILVCNSVSCMIMDYETIYNYISDKLGIKFGETTKDNRFTLLPVTCLGNCDNAPVIMINDDTYDRLTFNKLDELLSMYN